MSNSTILTLFAAVRMATEGHRMVTQGWALSEDAFESAGAGDQLLHYLKVVTMPTPALAPGPVLMDVPQAQQQSTL